MCQGIILLCQVPFISLLLFRMSLPGSDCHHLLVYITKIALNLLACQQSCPYLMHVPCCNQSNLFRTKTHRRALFHRSASTLFQMSQQCLVSFALASSLCLITILFKIAFHYFIVLCSLMPHCLFPTYIIQTGPGKFYLEYKTENKISYPNELFCDLLSPSDFSVLAQHTTSACPLLVVQHIRVSRISKPTVIGDHCSV